MGKKGSGGLANPTLALAILAWLVLSGAAWLLRKSRLMRSRRPRHRTQHAFRIS